MCPMVGTSVDKFFTHGMSVLSNMPLSGVCKPVSSTERDGVHMIALV